jgi:CelD/BcsL family acetyltransferase involved in cellulose biosynthesis
MQAWVRGLFFWLTLVELAQRKGFCSCRVLDPMDYTLVRSFSELDAYAAEWNALLGEGITHVPFLRHEYLRAWWTTRGGGEWPQSDLAVVLARQGPRLLGIAPLFVTPNRDNRPALMLLGSIEISDYLDLICRPLDLPAFLPGLLDFLAGSGKDLPRWELLDWQNIPEASPTLSLLRDEVEKRGWDHRIARTYRAPSIPLAGDFDTYLAGIDKKQRHEIRRKMRRAEESGQEVRWYIVEDEAGLDAEVDAFLGMMADDADKARFLHPAMREQMHLCCRAAFQQGWLQLAFLEADGVKAAAYLNFDYDNRIWVYNSGLDRRFTELSPGWVLLGYLLQWANEQGRVEFDFMRGEEEYKYRFGALDRFVVGAQVTRQAHAP